MHSDSAIKLTSAEISVLWRAYLSDTLSICFLKYFIATVKDRDIIPILEFTLKTSSSHIQTITDIFNKEGYPIPKGFTNEDVNVTAPPLYSDSFILFLLRHLARIGLNYYSYTFPQMAREDMVVFLGSCIASSTELTRRLIRIKLEKGIYLRPPIIEIPGKIDFVTDKNFTAGFMVEKRSLIVEEISNLFVNVHSNLIGKALFTGLNQCTESKQIKNFLTKGINIANKHIEIFSSKLKNEDIPISMPSDSFVTSSTSAPFSDKLIMYTASMMCTTSIENYAIATSTSMRHDIQADYVRLAAEVAKYSADGLNIMIEYGWLEQPPQAINHEHLTKA